MPIKKENRHLYPSNWKQIREEVRERAADMCEKCGVLNYDTVWRSTDGTAWMYAHGDNGELYDMDGNECHDDVWIVMKDIEIVCTVAHLDHDPTNNDLANLRFWCQKCHNSYDAPHRAETRKKSRQATETFTAYNAQIETKHPSL